jgi:hypothetical protein
MFRGFADLVDALVTMQAALVSCAFTADRLSRCAAMVVAEHRLAEVIGSAIVTVGLATMVPLGSGGLRRRSGGGGSRRWFAAGAVDAVIRQALMVEEEEKAVQHYVEVKDAQAAADKTDDAMYNSLPNPAYNPHRRVEAALACLPGHEHGCARRHGREAGH